MKKRYVVLFLVIPFIAACDKIEEKTQKPVEGRWYTQSQVDNGYQVYQANCAVCHKPDASGTTNWQQLDANGKLPPPPLNGTAHTWHHSMNILRRAVREGGIPLGGSMPGFKDKLNAEEIDAVLAWVMSNWPDNIYQVWLQRNQK